MYDIFDKLVKLNNINANKVSKDTGIPYSTFSDWKAGRSTPKYEKLKKIAEYLNVSVEYLNGEEPEEKQQYYLNDETARIAQEVFENKDLRLLFDASRNASPEDIRFAVEMLTRMKKKENFDE
jgi:transcriptional regulator with XRE-family HTH domain